MLVKLSTDKTVSEAAVALQAAVADNHFDQQDLAAAESEAVI